MTCLSFKKIGKPSFVIAANPIYVLDPVTYELGSKITFEVLSFNADLLQSFLRETRHYFDGHKNFWAVLISLEPCRGSHPNLLHLLHLGRQPVLRGVLSVVPEPPESR